MTPSEHRDSAREQTYADHVDDRQRERRISGRLVAAAGASAALLGAGAGELVAVLTAPASSPFAVVGGTLIDLAPPWAKDAAIALFGTGDKAALLVGIAIVLIGASALIGALEERRPPFGAITFGVLGFAVGIIATARPDAGTFAWMPPIAAGLVAAFAVRALLRRAPAPGRPPRTPGGETGPAPSEISRRRFFVWTGVAAAAGILAAAGGVALRAGSQAVAAVRRAIVLPTPAMTVAAVPTGAELQIAGLTPVVTPNADFYRIDTALVVPQVDPATWSLRIHGLVEQEVVLTWDELLALPLEESWTTLTCVSNPVGGDLIGNAKWLGYPLRFLLERAVPTAEADMVLSRSIDGFSASTPLGVLQDDTVAAILAVGMNGAPLPLEHGFPVRMVVPGLYGYVSATKWVTELELTRFDQASAYWTDRGWSERGPIKLASRIDVPRRGAGLSVGDTVIAGVAWQQHVGVAGVEVQIDDAPWQAATLATALSADTWVQWSMPWSAQPGRHTIRCRARNEQGETQTGAMASPVPDGATGWDELTVTVG